MYVRILHLLTCADGYSCTSTYVHTHIHTHKHTHSLPGPSLYVRSSSSSFWSFHTHKHKHAQLPPIHELIQHLASDIFFLVSLIRKSLQPPHARTNTQTQLAAYITSSSSSFWCFPRVSNPSEFAATIPLAATAGIPMPGNTCAHECTWRERPSHMCVCVCDHVLSDHGECLWARMHMQLSHLCVCDDDDDDDDDQVADACIHTYIHTESPHNNSFLTGVPGPGKTPCPALIAGP